MDSRTFTYNVVCVSTGVSCRQRGAALLQVSWLASTQSTATDGHSVDAAAVAITGAVVISLSSIP